MTQTDAALQALMAKFSQKEIHSPTSGNLQPSSQDVTSMAGQLAVETAAIQLESTQKLDQAIESQSSSNIVQPSSTGTTAPTPLSAADQIIGRVLQLQEALQQQSPGYEFLLHEIHTALARDENLIHFLSEEQIGSIVAGLSKKKNIVIAEGQAKSKGKGKGISVDDI